LERERGRGCAAGVEHVGEGLELVEIDLLDMERTVAVIDEQMRGTKRYAWSGIFRSR